MNSTAFTITNRYGDVLRGNIHEPGAGSEHATGQGAPVIIVCHGFKGFKDWGMFPHAASDLAGQGFFVLRFNFSLNGIGDDDQEFTALDRFEQNTISRELDDLGDLLDAVTGGALTLHGADTGRIAVIGHSLGAGVSIVKTAGDARIRAAVSWAGVADFDRWGPKFKKQWREQGRMEILNVRTGQMMPMGLAMLEDLETHEREFDIPAAAARLGRPLLLVHGDQDVSVPMEESLRIAAAADPSLTNLHTIHNTDHTFGTMHPFAGPTSALESLLRKTGEWLRSALAIS